MISEFGLNANLEAGTVAGLIDVNLDDVNTSYYGQRLRECYTIKNSNYFPVDVEVKFKLNGEVNHDFTLTIPRVDSKDDCLSFPLTDEFLADVIQHPQLLELEVSYKGTVFSDKKILTANISDLIENEFFNDPPLKLEVSASEGDDGQVYLHAKVFDAYGVPVTQQVTIGWKQIVTINDPVVELSDDFYEMNIKGELGEVLKSGHEASSSFYIPSLALGQDEEMLSFDVFAYRSGITGIFSNKKVKQFIRVAIKTRNIINFTDNNLKSCIQSTLGLTADETPSFQQTDELAELDCTGRDITDISALTSFKNLKSLKLNNNKITDITPLSSLAKLTYLDLSDNPIVDVSPLSGFDVLEELVLQNTLVSDPSLLGNLVYVLSYIDLRGSPVVDCSSAHKVTNHLCEEEPIVFSDSKLYSCIQFRLGLQADEVPSRSDLESIHSLACHNKSISDIGGIENLINLQSLVLIGNHISDISPLLNLTSLLEVFLGGNPVSDCSAVEHLTDTGCVVQTFINFADENLKACINEGGNFAIDENITLERLHAIEVLLCPNQSIKDISGLSYLINLQHLDLSYNQINDISELSGLNKLVSLHLEENPILDCSFVEHLTNSMCVVSSSGEDNQYMVAAGDGFNCALDAQGVFCWGRNGPMLHVPDDLQNPIQISSGGSHACALDDLGVHCWGENYFGATDVPVNLQNPIQVSAGYSHTCALDENGVHCWGSSGSYGETNVPSDLQNPSWVSAGMLYTCALDDVGVHCWGRDISGETRVPSDLRNPVKISAGIDVTCALDDSGVRCWGRNIGDVPNDLLNPTQVTVGSGHACALDDLGVHCWGNNYFEQTTVPDNLVNTKQITTYRGHSCALDDSKVQCWGRNQYGQTNPSHLQNPVKLFLGVHNACALDDFGMRCWDGSDIVISPEVLKNAIEIDSSSSRGLCTLGDTLVNCIGYPIDARLPSSFIHPMQIRVGNDFACALDDSGVRCWGEERWGATVVPDSLINPFKISSGFGHVCALDEFGVSCWGRNLEGQLNIPNELINPVQISSDGFTNCAIGSSGVHCWGGSIWNPILNVPTDLLNPTKIAVGVEHACVLSDLGVQCWGFMGIDGDGNHIEMPNDLNNPIDVSVSGGSTCVLDGENVKCWGKARDFYDPLRFLGASAPRRLIFN